MTSIAAREVYRLASVYCATKHALSALARSFRVELQGHGIKVTEIAPGMVDTAIREGSTHPAVTASVAARKFAPLTAEEVDRYAYRRSSVLCVEIVGEPRVVAGRNVNDQSGYVQVATCRLGNGGQADVQLGWARGLSAVSWEGGEVTGSIEPLRTGFAKLVADPPLEGLAASAPPKKKVIDHMAYAGQWFFFALTALLIYFLAIRSTLAGRREGED